MSIRGKGGVYGSSDSFRIDASEFSALLNDVKAFDKTLGLAIRKRIRDSAKPIVKKMQKAVTDPKSRRSSRIVVSARKQRSGAEYKKTTSTSKLVARGITFRVRTGKTGGAGAFVASAKHLPEDRDRMNVLFNRESFRHPVFARTTRARGIRGFFGKRDTVWVEQAGRPYFDSVALDEQKRLRDAIDEALNDAAEALGRSRIRGPR